jgi:hypothetical protein
MNEQYAAEEIVCRNGSLMSVIKLVAASLIIHTATVEGKYPRFVRSSHSFIVM